MQNDNDDLLKYPKRYLHQWPKDITHPLGEPKLSPPEPRYPTIFGGKTQWSISANGVLEEFPGHPHYPQRMVPQRRLMIEAKIGEILPPRLHISHKDKNVFNVHPTNLRLRLHARNQYLNNNRAYTPARSFDPQFLTEATQCWEKELLERPEWRFDDNTFAWLLRVTQDVVTAMRFMYPQRFLSKEEIMARNARRAAHKEQRAK